MNTKPLILVVGSINTDMVVKSTHLPGPGETVLGGEFIINPGGKGANQAVAAAKMGGNVTMLGRVGSDDFGSAATDNLNLHGVNIDHIIYDQDYPSGVALIMVDDHGENCISVASGANARLHPDDISAAHDLTHQAAYVLVQLESPIETITHVLSMCNASTLKILNPAPGASLAPELLMQLDIITPNQSEAELLTNVAVVDESSALEAAGILRQMGVAAVVITMGAQGAYVDSEGYRGMIPGYNVMAVDSTAAGDTFNGALVVALSEGTSLYDAVVFANKAAALAVTKVGAQSSIPMLEEVRRFPLSQDS